MPEGGIPVVVNSREWYDLLLARRTSSTTCTSRRTTPSPTAGPRADLPRLPLQAHGPRRTGASCSSPRPRIDSFDRRAADWDYLVSPARTPRRCCRGTSGTTARCSRSATPATTSCSPPARRRRSGAGPGSDSASRRARRPSSTRRRSATTSSTDDNRAVMADFLDFAARPSRRSATTSCSWCAATPSTPGSAAPCRHAPGLHRRHRLPRCGRPLPRRRRRHRRLLLAALRLRDHRQADDLPRP